jgi:hypothetical protein
VWAGRPAGSWRSPATFGPAAAAGLVVRTPGGSLRGWLRPLLRWALAAGARPVLVEGPCPRGPRAGPTDEQLDTALAATFTATAALDAGTAAAGGARLIGPSAPPAEHGPSGSPSPASLERAASTELGHFNWVRLLWSEAGEVCDVGFCA